MLIAGLVIMANICASSVSDFHVVRYNRSDVKEEFKSSFQNDLVISSDEILVDIEENQFEVEEKEEKKESDLFNVESSFINSGALVFNWSSAKVWIGGFFRNCQCLSLYILFEDFRL
jgi:hypothetical protein